MNGIQKNNMYTYSSIFTKGLTLAYYNSTILLIVLCSIIDGFNTAPSLIIDDINRSSTCFIFFIFSYINSKYVVPFDSHASLPSILSNFNFLIIGVKSIYEN